MGKKNVDLKKKYCSIRTKKLHKMKLIFLGLRKFSDLNVLR